MINLGFFLRCFVNRAPGSERILVFYVNSVYDVVILAVQLKCKIISSLRSRRSTSMFIVQADKVRFCQCV